MSSNRFNRKPTNATETEQPTERHWVRMETKTERKDFREFDENEGTEYPDLLDTVIVVLRRKFVALHKES